MDDFSALRGRIFVAGTGRSGSTRMAWLLGLHPQVWAVPTEARFLIDPDGLEDLVHHLTDGYTFYHADQAVKRFDQLVRKTMTGETETGFKHWYLDKRMDEERYYRRINQFVAELVALDFEEKVPLDWWSEGKPNGRHWPSQQKTHRRTIGRFFPDREELLVLCRRLVDGIFAESALAEGKPFWCEKTPLNMLAMPFLWELFEDATIVHIKRDPRGVAYSLKNQWGFEHIDEALTMLLPYYERWRRFRESGFNLQTKRYIEMRVEDICVTPDPCMRSIQLVAGMTPAPYPQDTYSAERTNRWQKDMTHAERARCEEVLGPYFELMGYDLARPGAGLVELGA